MAEKRYMYITDDDYLKAEANGVSQRALEQRVRNLGWDVDRAVKTPIKNNFRPNGRWKRWKDIAVVGYATFASRINNGWSEEAAATTPTLSRKECSARGKTVQMQKACIPLDKIQIAEKNGIRRATAYMRVNVYGWTIEEAITTPVTLSSTERKKRKGQTNESFRSNRRI